MVFLHFPVTLTEEEEILKLTLARLKKKKKHVQLLKAAANSQEKETTHNKTVNKPVPAPSMDSADKATEQAKKLVQSGAIKVLGQKEKSGFKRSKTFEKKKDTEKPAAPVGFQPFMSFSGDAEEDKPSPAKRIKGLGESFVSAGFGNKSYDRPQKEHREAPKKGNTVYVHGIGISEDLIKKSFSTFGKIVNINMEAEKNTAFVTFEKMEAADQAISDVNGSMINSIQMQVQMARRQPTLDSSGESSSAGRWRSIASSDSQKLPDHKDQRAVLSYDDMF